MMNRSLESTSSMATPPHRRMTLPPIRHLVFAKDRPASPTCRHMTRTLDA